MFYLVSVEAGRRLGSGYEELFDSKEYYISESDDMVE